MKRLVCSLSGRLVLSVLVIHALLVPILFGAILAIVERGIQDQFTNQVRLSAGQFAQLLENEFFKHDDSNINALLDDALLGGQVIFAEINIHGGDIIRGSLGTQINADQFHEDYAYGQNNDAVYFISLPIHNADGKPRALFRLGYDETYTQEEIDRAYQRTLYIVLGYIALSIALVAFWGRKLTGPLQRLRETSRKIASGQVEEQLVVTSNIKEIEDLSEDLNYMRSELVKQANALEHQALHDFLTGLPNRVLLNDRLQQAVLTGERVSAPFALMLLDLDRFKDVNDTLGHQTGDNLLQQVAVRLRATVRDSDTVTRLGGDEFAMILHGADREQATRVAEKILAVMESPFPIEGRSLHVGASIGITLFPSDGDNPATLMRHADIAMYAAKRSDVHYEHYDPGHDHYSLHKLMLDSDFHTAISQKKLYVYYQPKIDLSSGSVVGVEALVRWYHPERGIILPEEFIPFAEKSSLIGLLMQGVMQETVNQCGIWHRTGRRLTVAVNLSPKNLQDNHLMEKIAKVLEKAQVAPEYLELELTENAIFEEPKRAVGILNDLHAMGVRIAIDDFGMGYSSLSSLKRLPISVIKIDKSFIFDMAQNSTDATIVRAAINMAHDLDITVVAEGVENPETLYRLRELGCDYVQGNYFSPAVPVTDFDRWLRRYLREFVKRGANNSK